MNRRLVVAGILVSTAVLGMSACVVSPRVGDEKNEVTASRGGSGNGTGAELLGNVVSFTTQVVAGEPSDGVCTPRQLPVNDDGSVACMLFSARFQSGGSCLCDGPGERPASEEGVKLVKEQLALGSKCGSDTGVDCEDACVCEVLEAAGQSASDCLYAVDPPPSTAGWCYVDPSLGRGSAELVADCDVDFRRRIRVFQGELDPAGIDYVLACSGGPVTSGTSTPGPSPVGAPCVPELERSAGFSGFSLNEVNVEFGSPDCESNVCVINHFQGRVSCPYGNQAGSSPCYLPGSDTTVSVPVDPQLIARPAEDAAICSCRCAGPGPGPFCACPSGTECSPVVREIGAHEGENFEGSYCIPPGTAYDPEIPQDGSVCLASEMHCGDPRPY